MKNAKVTYYLQIVDVLIGYCKVKKKKKKNDCSGGLKREPVRICYINN